MHTIVIRLLFVFVRYNLTQYQTAGLIRDESINTLYITGSRDGTVVTPVIRATGSPLTTFVITMNFMKNNNTYLRALL